MMKDDPGVLRGLLRELKLHCNFATAMLIPNLGYQRLLMQTLAREPNRAARFSTVLPDHWGRRQGCDFRADGSGWLISERRDQGHRSLVRHATPLSDGMRRHCHALTIGNGLETPVGTPGSIQAPWVARRGVGRLSEWSGEGKRAITVGYATQVRPFLA